MLFIAAVAALMGRHYLEPRYAGHTKDHWLRVFAKEGFSRPGLEDVPLSTAQKEALSAFHFFDGDGISYLINKASGESTLSSTELSILNLVHLLPWNKPWKSQRSPYQDYRHEIRAAYVLLTELGIPFKWAEQHAKPLLKSSEPENIALGLNILACSTNQLDSVATYASKYIGHSHSLIHRMAQDSLAKTGEHAAVGIPKLIPVSPRYSLSGMILLKEWAPQFDAIHDIIDQQLQNPNALHAFKYTVIKMSIAKDPSPQIESIRSLILAEFDPSRKKSSWSGMLGFLKSWPYSIEPLVQTLMEIVNQHNETVVSVAEIFEEHQLDITPLKPFLHLALQGSTSPFAPSNAELPAALFLLQMDYQDQKAWDQLNKYYTPAGARGLSDRPVLDQMITALAPYSNQAKTIYNRHPIFQQEYSNTHIGAARSLLRKRNLLPPPGFEE